MAQTKQLTAYTEFLNTLNRPDEFISENLWQEDLFSAERFEQYASSLARELKVRPVSKKVKSLRPELRKNTEKLEQAYTTLANAISQKQGVSPAAEWFVDNFHIIENQLKEIKSSLPDNYYYGLPQIESGELMGYPRVYAIALAIGIHTDGRLDPALLQRFLSAFQKEAPLKIGELWAFVITLRIVMIQHLTVLAMKIVRSRENRKRADALSEELLAYAVRPEVSEKDIHAYMDREIGTEAKSFNRAFIVQLIQRLRDQDPSLGPAFDWLEAKLAVLGTNSQEAVKVEMQRLASGQLTVGNIIASMRLFSSVDWREFIETVNLIDPILAQDPANAYSHMDFTTRDSYRHVIEGTAKRSNLSEVEVAHKVIEKARQSGSGRESHIGFHLVGKGKDSFRKDCGYRPYFKERIYGNVLYHPTGVYLGLVMLVTAIFLVPVVTYFSDQVDHFWWVLGFALIAIFPASDLALSFINHYVTFFVKPAPLPRMDTEKGLPADAGTMVVIPTLFSKVEVVRELLERLEIHALANQDPALSFALLGDFTDAPQEKMPADEALLRYATQGIAELNHRYCQESEPKFHLFHRKRQWNESEGAWIGWERKRGKLLEFNRLLRGATDTSYIIATADPQFLSEVKYVITLDSDTQLPRDAAKKLVGTITHPLNRPVLDERKQRVTNGYGILQPRISITATSAQETYFARMSSGNIGIDPYTTAVSDVYQDLFKEGSFTGKGLYVVDAFEKAMEDRVPENAVLSHDLFEGSYARSALITDVELFDDYPADYETFSKRQHRWTRGDWQIFPWLFPTVRDAHGKKVKNDLSIISRWKILDNLRRSISPIAALLWLTLAWTVLPGSPLLWTLLIVMLYLFPVYSTVATGEWTRRRGVTWRGHFQGSWREFKIKLGHIFLVVGFLPKQAWTQGDAIIRALYRMFFSRKHLLEWTSFAQLKGSKSGNLKLSDFLDSGPILAFIMAALVFVLRPEALGVALPFILVWIANPLIKHWLRLSPTKKTVELSANLAQDYRRYARSTWHFFETFVNDEGHWLAPDNFQEDPAPVVALRTSPTNIGLQLLAQASAYDLGYIATTTLLEQVEKTFSTLDKLPRMHGHFFNWYDTRTLLPLEPRYISTVDSGNLAGHLLTFKQFLQELVHTSRTHECLRVGLKDTLKQLQEEVGHIHATAPVTGTASTGHVKTLVAKALERVEVHSDWRELLNSQNKYISEASDILDALRNENTARGAEFEKAQGWMKATLELIRSYLLDLDLSPEELNSRAKSLQDQADRFAQEMDFKFLFDEKRKLFVIGHNVNDNRRDNSYYDLLASESRLASFVAIAKGDIPQEHWFRLGRQMTAITSGGRALIAWTATMFEYLMPVLVMRRYSDTLLDHTYEAVVKRQIEYGREKGVPWGISEAGYHARDLQMNYQYGPFGIPGLGLKRGLSEELVVSPYSTMLAATIDPDSAATNLQDLIKLGALGRFGFYESLDYTAERVPKNQKYVVLKSYMAHHQGMSLLAMNNLLNDSIMQKRFHLDPLVQSTELLLQERMPQNVNLSQPRSEEINISGFLNSSVDVHPRLYSDVNLSLPRTQLLSNGNYTVMLTSTGAGFSKAGPLAVSRWREDATRDHWGQFFYIRNRTSGKYWSATYQPTTVTPQSFGVTFSEEKVEYWRRDSGTLTRMEVFVSTEDDVELRKITLTNESNSPQEYEVTSFMEAVLAKPNDDAAHPAFSNLFVQTEYLPQSGALLATRRKRKNQETPPWGFHLVTADAPTLGALQYETDRARFIGRGRTVAAPLVIHENRPLSNSTGSVLDPALSLRQTIRLKPGEAGSLIFVTGVGRDRAEANFLIDKYRDPPIYKREAELAWTQSQVQLRHLNISNAKAHIYQRLAGRVLYLDSSLRPAAHVLAKNSKAQTHLWVHGISGDLPIILTQINDEKDMVMVRELLHAHEYLRLKGLAIDLVIMNEHATSYLQPLSDEILRQIRMSGSQALLDKPGGIFVRRTDLLPPDDIVLLRTVARVVIHAERGSLEEQLKHRKPRPEMPPSLLPKAILNLPPSGATRTGSALKGQDIPELDFFNGLGGFSKDGREYIIHLQEDQWTPAPWINVIANSHDFGFIVSESGSGYTWSANSRENRITPWSNDPVSDPPGEVIYIRDEESGNFWTPTPLPIRKGEAYNIRHGQGYTTFEHTSHAIEQTLDLFVPMSAPVKISRLTLKNTGTTSRKLSVTSYVEWVLGFGRSSSAPYVIPEFDQETGAILARNPYNNEFAHRVSFTAISEISHSYTCDRREFLGRNGSPASPAALRRTGLSGTSGPGLDPCGAFHVKIDLAPGEEKTILVLLGQAESTDKAREIINIYREKNRANKALTDAVAFWEKTSSSIEIRTPDQAMNTLVNRWLLYQTLSCRVWARSAFYQSGGAFGFRDQLQDVMALAYSHPEITRTQILTAAARQFKEGDVQHWWHPPTGRGVRTHFSDDLIWLPFVTSHYLKVTGDTSVLDEIIPFIEAPLLAQGQEDSYTHPQISDETGSIYEHCARTLDRSLKVGRHGLPLMGAGDWNDGMNRVGHEGEGESVWVAWFLYSALTQFLPICRQRGDEKRVKAYEAHLLHLKKAVEEKAWDGDWYRRAYFDDGTPLGSAQNEECRIDSISNSWAVLSHAGDPNRSAHAMAAVEQYLIRRGDGLIQLFTPPFDKTPMDPGYIKGYVPGVRENGGQYTHAAIWTVMAFAELGDGDRAHELYALLNPINHSSTRAGLHKYKVEPYVVAADIYGMHPHIGRGGWTWYTGSASWMYRSAIESILGLEFQGEKFRVRPKVPLHWREFGMSLKRPGANYEIQIIRSETSKGAELDGKGLDSEWVPLLKDRENHKVIIRI